MTLVFLNCEHKVAKKGKTLPEMAEITPVYKNRYKKRFIAQYCWVSLSLLGVCWTAHEDSWTNQNRAFNFFKFEILKIDKHIKYRRVTPLSTPRSLENNLRI